MRYVYRRAGIIIPQRNQFSESQIAARENVKLETPLKLRGVSAVYWKISGRPRVVKPLAANSVTTTLFCPLEQWQISSFPSSLRPTTIPTWESSG
uniref:Uncharacterized protein n=1 Tax=Siphoviridae sp. ctb1k4 TaxID=2826391 RepID=A0A8S5MU75_9CAUD|nr:MAG TPA: hypothetical protein [Siphoviridae sp. ctb1k4]